MSGKFESNVPAVLPFQYAVQLCTANVYSIVFFKTVFFNKLLNLNIIVLL